MSYHGKDCNSRIVIVSQKTEVPRGTKALIALLGIVPGTSTFTIKKSPKHVKYIKNVLINMLN